VKAFSDLSLADRFGPLRLTISAAANERYWRAAGLDHPLLRAGHLYPMIAGNLTVLAFGTACPDPVIQTRQRLRCHGTVLAGTELVTEGVVVATYEKRGRAYVDLEATVVDAAAPDVVVWESDVTFTPTATFASTT
jgi:hypothetical protein